MNLILRREIFEKFNCKDSCAYAWTTWSKSILAMLMDPDRSRKILSDRDRNSSIQSGPFRSRQNKTDQKILNDLERFCSIQRDSDGSRKILIDQDSSWSIRQILIYLDRTWPILADPYIFRQIMIDPGRTWSIQTDSYIFRRILIDPVRRWSI